MTFRERRGGMTCTESAAADMSLTERRYEHPEMYNRVIGYARPWTTEEHSQVMDNVMNAVNGDPVAAQELLEILGFG